MKKWLANHGTVYGVIIFCSGFLTMAIIQILAQAGVISSSVYMVVANIAIGCGVFCLTIIALSEVLKFRQESDE